VARHRLLSRRNIWSENLSDQVPPREVNTEPMAPTLRIEYMPLSQLKKYPGNPKQHDLETLDGSFNRFGYTAPIMIDEKSSIMVSGHGRVKQLSEESCRTASS